jgi:uncharacterized surface protein with fasciclin (FAS1) repeats
MRSAVLLTVLLLGSTTLAQSSLNIVQSAASIPGFTTLSAQLKAAGLVETLSGPGPFTVLAPTDEAFAKLPPAALAALAQDPAALKAVILRHAVAGSFPVSVATQRELKRSLI